MILAPILREQRCARPAWPFWLHYEMGFRYYFFDVPKGAGMNRTQRRRVLLAAAVIVPLMGVFLGSVYAQAPGFPRPGIPGGGIGPKFPTMPTPPGFPNTGMPKPGFPNPGFPNPGMPNPGIPGVPDIGNPGSPFRSMDRWPFGEYYCTGCNQRVSASSTSCPRCRAKFSNVDAFGRPTDEPRPGMGNPGFPQMPPPNFGPNPGFNPPAAPNPGFNPPVMPNPGARDPDLGGPNAAAPGVPNFPNVPNAGMPNPGMPNVGVPNMGVNPGVVPNPIMNRPAVAPQGVFPSGREDSSDLSALWIILGVLGGMGIIGGVIFAIVRGVSQY